jgi:type I restriction-modification system DNA methylase subunit
MAAITIEPGLINKTIQDPACGSGRMLLSAAKIERNNYFFGADIDNRCCKMTVINMCLNDLQGEVAWMNSLSQEHWGGFSVNRKFGVIPTITKLNAGEGILANRKSHTEKVYDTIKIGQTKFEFE